MSYVENIAAVGGNAVSTGAGANGSGCQRITLATDDAASTETHGSRAAGTAASKADLVGGVYNTAAPAPTNGQQVALQLDSAGNLRINPAGNTGSFTSYVTAAMAGNSLSPLTVPAGKKWVVKSVYINCVIANSGSARAVSVSFKDATPSSFFGIVMGIAAPINATTAYSCGPGLPLATTITSNNATCPAPEGALGPGFTIVITVTGGVAGDTITLRANVEEYSD